MKKVIVFASRGGSVAEVEEEGTGPFFFVGQAFGPKWDATWAENQAFAASISPSGENTVGQFGLAYGSRETIADEVERWAS